MKVDVEKLPESQVELTFEVESETVDKYVQRAYRSLVNRVNVPGFRKGKAPRFVVERMVGKDTLFQEGMELLLPEVYKQAVEEKDIHPIDQPVWDVVQTEPLIAKAKVPVRPTVELGSYRDIRLAKEEPQITEERVDAVIEQMREQESPWVPVERPAAMGDRVTVDIEAHLKGESLLEGAGGEALIQGSGEQLLNTKGTEYLLKPQPDAPFPGLTEEIAGLKAGEEKDFELTLPETFPEKEKAGQKALFHVAVHTVTEKNRPELDDEFAKTVGDFATMDELRDEVRKELQARANAEAESRFADAVVQMAVDRSIVEIPKVMIDREDERGLERMGAQLQQQGISLDHYLRTVKKTREELLEQMRPAAEERIKRSLVLDEIGRVENVEVSPEEIDGSIESTIAAMGEQGEKARQALNSDQYRTELGYSLRDQKVVKLLIDIASREDVDGTESAVVGEPIAEDQPAAEE
ncbi:MAG: trigger factor [Chloroflexi bacterium]|nr:trigger factor [Chloroflexota bacterium]